MHPFLQILNTVDRPGQFYATGGIGDCFLGLYMPAVGDIALPILPQQVQALIEHCEQAPYGRGEDTLVDTEVRKVWQLDASQIQIRNPRWSEVLADLVVQITRQLGLGKSRVTAELYKFLIYEAGSFFQAHRDSEKADHMFATLVIVLPSAHEGGELIIEHAGEQTVLRFDGKDALYAMRYAAFYADCRHEVKPVQQGYRCCLVYNLMLQQAEQQPAAPQHQQQLQALSDYLRTHFQAHPGDKLILDLKHQYSATSLAFTHLKNEDYAHVDILRKAAQQADCHIYLALLTHWQSGDVSYDYDLYYDDEDECDMEEIYDESLSITHWLSLEEDSLDQRLTFGEMPFTEAEMISEQAIEDWEQSEQEIHAPTGNEGTSMERWYHRAAVVLWPRSQHFAHLYTAGKAAVVEQLQQAIAQWAKSGDKDRAEYQDICNAVHSVIHKWTAPSYPGTDYDTTVQTFFDSVQQLDDVALLQQFIEKILSQGISGNEGKTLLAICERAGWDNFAAPLQHLFQQKAIKPPLYLPVLQSLCGTTPLADNTPRHALCRELLARTLTRLKQEPPQKPLFSSDAHPEFEAGQIIQRLLWCNLSVQDEQLAQRTADLIKEGQYYAVDDSIAPVLLELARQTAMRDSPVYQSLRAYSIEELAQLTKDPVVEPSDWKQDIKLSCQCNDCAGLQSFLLDPVQQVHRFRVRKDRRQHLHNIITKHNCDMTHITERKGSPQTLVCTKTRTHYQRDKKQWETRLELLESLREI